MKIVFEIIKIIIVAIIGYFYNCISESKILIFDDYLKPGSYETISKNSVKIFLVLFIIYIIVHVLNIVYNKLTKDKSMFKNMAHLIFDKMTVDLKDEHKHHLRVTIFKAYKMNSSKAYLKQIARYQTRIPIINTKIKFKHGEGCAGVCFATQNIIQKSINDYDPENPDIYFNQCEKELSLNKKIARKVNSKSSWFFCLPLKSFTKSMTWGVVVIDNEINMSLDVKKSRKIEEMINSISFLFERGNI